jgi:tetratricopeptide (TPR) repeat protein
MEDKMKKKFQALLTLLSFLALCILSGACSSGHATGEPISLIDSEFAADSNDPEIGVAIKAINEAPGSAGGYLRLAATYIKRARETGDFSINRKAIKVVDRAIEIDPESAPARKLKASLLATFHRFPEARELGLELQKEFPNDPFIYGVLTDANVELGNYDEAVRSAQKMIDLKPNSSSYARAGHLRSLNGDHLGAIDMMDTGCPDCRS